MERAAFADDDIHELMLSCWETNPENRPSFHELSVYLSRSLDDGAREVWIYYLISII